MLGTFAVRTGLLVILWVSCWLGVQGGNCVNDVCDWDPWKAWSACSATCGGGRQQRYRAACCDSSWTEETCISVCSFHIPDQKETRGCAQSCSSGRGTWNGAYCACGGAFYGSCCSFVITCGDPGQVPNAVRSGSDFGYSATVTYACQQFYNLTAGSAARVCRRRSWGSSGVWSDSAPVCTFVNTCGSNPCQNEGSCVDGLNQYTCHCPSGWSGSHCEIDILPPAYDSCPSNSSHIVRTPRAEVNWTEPVFSDAHGQQVFRTSNYPGNHAVLPWGEFVVQYIGSKPSNGLQTECKFTISVYPTPCDPLAPPVNGVFVCNGWNAQFGEVCVLMCDRDWDPQYGVDITENYVCGASGMFIPQPTFQGCTEQQFEPDSRTSDEQRHFYSGTCDSADTQREIGLKYIELLKKSLFPEMCTEWDQQCTADNVKIICGA